MNKTLKDTIKEFKELRNKTINKSYKIWKIKRKGNNLKKPNCDNCKRLIIRAYHSKLSDDYSAHCVLKYCKLWDCYNPMVSIDFCKLRR